MSASTSDTILIDDREGVRVITLHRPEKLNAFNIELLTAFRQAIVQAAADDTVHVTVVTGAGRAFSVGADLAEMAQSHDEMTDGPRPGKQLFEDLQATLETFPKPLIGTINGLGVGFGFTFLGYCDFALLAKSARLRTPFSQLGLSPEASSSYLFPLRMGWRAAARALMLGDWFSAEEVVACGLAQEVVEDADLMDAALALAHRLAQAPLQSLIATKALMLQAHLPAMRAARILEGETIAGLIGTPANRAAVQAFTATRKSGN